MGGLLLGVDAAAAGGGGAFDPSTIAGLILWLKADSESYTDGGAVTTFHDRSGNGNDQAAVSSPTYKTGVVNGLPIVRFGGSHYLQNISFPLPAQYTVLAVAISTSAASIEDVVCSDEGAFGASLRHLQFRYNGDGTFRAIAFDNSANLFAANQTVAATSWQLVECVRDGDSVTVLVGGTAGTPTSTTGAPASGTSYLVVGCRKSSGPGVFFTGDLAEVLMYNSALGSADRINAENYLKTKYGL